MKRKQLVALVICTLGMYVMGNMVITLLPVYAMQLGMDESMIGVYFSLAFTMITIGALISGRLSDRFQRRKRMIILVCIAAIPATFLMGHVSSLVLMTVCTMVVWFMTGISVAMLNILTGMYADPHERGRIFGLLSTIIALGQVIGGFSAGAIAERWGFTALYSVAALVWLVTITSALFLQDDKSTRPPEGQPKSAAVSLSRALWLLLVANTLVSITGFSSGLARPLMMNRLGFDANLISSAATISGLVALPLPFLVGWLSDRTGRKQLLIASYVVSCVGMLALIGALNLWQFWLSASLITLAGGAGGVANAYVTDLAPPEALSTALARFSATPWIAGIVGYGATGIVIQKLGVSPTLLIGAALPVLAILMMLSVRKGVRVVPA